MILENVMGFKYKAFKDSEYKSSTDFNIYTKLVNIPLFPEKNDTSERPLGSDITYDFEDGYSKKIISIYCQFAPGVNYSERRYILRDIVAWLSKPGYLIINAESDRLYEAKLSSQAVDYTTDVKIDTFTLNFETQPVSENVVSSAEINDLTWDTADMTWDSADFPWDGIGDIDNSSVASGTTLTMTNLGNYKAKPTITLSGTTNTVTLTDDSGNSFTFENLNGTVYIDCKYKLVYSLSGTTKVNKRANLKKGSKYLELEPGTNNIKVTGNSNPIAVKIDFNATYL